MPEKSVFIFSKILGSLKKISNEIFVKFQIKSFIKITQNKVIKFGYKKCKLEK